MRMKSTLGAALCAVAAAVLLIGCGPKNTATVGGAATGTPATGAAPAASPTPSPSPVQVVKDLTPGNCTLYPKADAVTLLGGVNVNNKSLNIQTDGGTPIDLCSYIYLKSQQDLQGITYAVVRYDSAATAFAEAQKVQTIMLGSAAANNWPVQSLTTPAPGAGQVLGGYGTKTDESLTSTIAVVGTNVGSYLVAALGASSENPDNAKSLALKVFAALNTAVS
jgi:hypothetical protein